MIPSKYTSHNALKKKPFSQPYQSQVSCSISNTNLINLPGLPTSSTQFLKSRPLSTIKRVKEEIVGVQAAQRTVNLSRNMLNNILIIGQVWNKIILALDLNSPTLLAIDQHAVHERIRYEYYHALLSSTLLHSQTASERYLKFNRHFISLKSTPEPTLAKNVNIPYQLQKTLTIPKKLAHMLEIITIKYNIDLAIVSEDGDNFKIRTKSLPCILGEQMGPELVYDILQLLESQQCEGDMVLKLPKTIDELLMSKSCKNAIKFNDKLTLNNAKGLVRELLNCEHPLFCVHGRNSIYPLHNLETITKHLKKSRPHKKLSCCNL